jgi:uncharacterized protein YndB with AHSA1/START domain
MKWLLVTAAVSIALVALAALIGSRLPRDHRAWKQQTFAVGADRVWQVITDVGAYPSWRGDVKTVQRLPDRQGHPVWLEEGRSGKMTLAVERSEPPRLLVVRIADPDLPFGGTWTYEIEPAASGSRVTITENGEVYNPLFRFMARFIFGYDGTIGAYMDALGRQLR